MHVHIRDPNSILLKSFKIIAITILRSLHGGIGN